MFSLEWFITPAGIFMTVGVLLLIIALVIFIVTKNKGKKDKKKEGNNVAPAEPTITAVPSGPTPIDANVAPTAVEPAQPVATPDMAMPMDNGVAPVADPVASGMATGVEVPNVYSTDPVDNNAGLGQDMNNMAVGMEVPQVELPDAVDSSAVQTMDTPEIPNVYSQDIPAQSVVADPVAQQPVEVPAVQPEVQMPEQQVVQPVQDNNINNGTIPVPSVEQVMPEITPGQPVEQVAAAPVDVAPQPAPYGGAEMTVPSFTEQQATQPQIYGGANPLENTQQVAISDITAGMNNATPQPEIQQPVVEQPTPTVEPVATMPEQQVATPNYAAPSQGAEMQAPTQSNQAAYQAAGQQVQIPNINNQ